MKTYTQNIVATSMEEAVKRLIIANNSNTDILKNVVKKYNHLAISFFCFTVAGYLTYRMVERHEKRIASLEKTVNTLVQIEAGIPSEQPSGE